MIGIDPVVNLSDASAVSDSGGKNQFLISSQNCGSDLDGELCKLNWMKKAAKIAPIKGFSNPGIFTKSGAARGMILYFHKILSLHNCIYKEVPITITSSRQCVYCVHGRCTEALIKNLSI